MREPKSKLIRHQDNEITCPQCDSSVNIFTLVDNDIPPLGKIVDEWVECDICDYKGKSMDRLPPAYQKVSEMPMNNLRYQLEAHREFIQLLRYYDSGVSIEEILDKEKTYIQELSKQLSILYFEDWDE